MSGLGDLLGGLAGGASGGGGLDDVLEKLTGSGGTAPGGLGGMLAGLVPVVSGMLEHGGLQKVLAQLEASGLGSQAASWVGTGANQAISAADIEKVLGSPQLAGIAEKLGVSPDEAAGALAQVLPAVVDTVSPKGELPPEADVDAALARLTDGKPASG
jgi:uncharacterized protein YidB (DUF937 family)